MFVLDIAMQVHVASTVEVGEIKYDETSVMGWTGLQSLILAYMQIYTFYNLCPTMTGCPLYIL